jgi:hypothetical protein
MTTTTTTGLMPVIGSQRGGETVPRPDPEPIYTELAQRWEREGRLVPGRDDQEWTPLAGRYPWPGR